MRGLAARLKGRLRQGTILGPAYILAAPYCCGEAAVTGKLLEIGAATSPAPRDLALLQRHRTLIAEANVSVQTHLAPAVYLLRHRHRVRHILAPLTARLAGHDLFAHGPFGQTVLHPYVCKAILPEARLIWVSRGKKDWLGAVEHLECANPAMYPEHIGWVEDRAAREEVLLERRQRERRKFLRLAKAFPDDCLDVKLADPDLWERLAAFARRPWPGPPDIAALGAEDEAESHARA
ncbi:MAG: hypothetical protein AAFP13_07745 [Pseudomonadota bacterium]